MSVEGAVLARLADCGAPTRVAGPVGLDPVPPLPALSVASSRERVAGGYAEAAVRLSLVGESPGDVDDVRDAIRPLMDGASWMADGTTVAGASWRSRGELAPVEDLGLTVAEDEWTLLVAEE